MSLQHTKNIADCLGVIGFPAQSFEQYISGKDNGSAACRHVIAEPLKFAAQAQQGFAGSEKSSMFYWFPHKQITSLLLRALKL